MTSRSRGSRVSIGLQPLTAAFLGIVLSLVLPSLGHAFPLTSSKAWQHQYSVELVPAGFNFDGIVAMSNCSASFIRIKGSSEDAKGLLLTNGHCVGGGAGGGMLRPGEILLNRPRAFRVNLLDRKATRIAQLRAEKIVYATMTDTDMAILELTQSYREIKAQAGVDALVLADVKPQAGTKIDVASGYWKRTYNCEIEAFVPQLKEGDWMFRESIRYSPKGCEVIGGTSGSPIIASNSGEVIGVNNTTNENGGRCTLNNPCEIDENGNVSIIQGRGYGQQTYWVYTCLDKSLAFDLKVEGCELPKGNSSFLPHFLL